MPNEEEDSEKGHQKVANQSLLDLGGIDEVRVECTNFILKLNTEQSNGSYCQKVKSKVLEGTSK